ncbi:MAG: pyridoxamine 5'-phosphate oxidase family protein [Actinobacteria bacterium]|nr:pyridoxamine 5'-phosphate oxidase family protein [Actinomycetota bacterium]
MAEPRAERPHMPDYGVDTSSWAPLPWSWAADRLIANRNFWVVTVSAEGRPHALPVWGVWDDAEARFAFSCGRRARKARNLAANPRAVIMTEDTVECLSLEGRAWTVGDDVQQRRWIELYLAKYQPISADVSAEFLRQNLMVEFEPERSFAVIEREEEFSTRATRWVFDRRA